MQSTSLYLDPDTWDITLDSVGRLKTVSNPYSIAQDVACACKTVLGEVIYDQTIGIPFFNNVFGKPVSTSLVSHYLQKQATRLDTVETAQVSLSKNRSSRTTSGEIVITDTNGSHATLIL
ncbi:hypothetical protein LMG33818_000063 [Halomonadaceae bacterium LMG 33818]|uniref:hypothetical protein n=1 Tax=Cernens ardua TaxID=3402176 RepID=UPI003EDC4FAB